MLLTIDQAKAKLENDELVAIPTETVYGLAANACSSKAIEKIYIAKNRPSDNPLICHFASWNDALSYIEQYPNWVEDIVTAFCPGPLSILVNLKPNSPLKSATRGLEQVIIRIPDHPLAIELLNSLNFPLAAPSANTSGFFSPTNAAMVENDLGQKIAGVIDGGPCKVGLESTIIDVRDSQCLKILRPGSIGADELKAYLPLTVRIEENSAVEQTTPGTKYRHYAPKTEIHNYKFFNQSNAEYAKAILTCSEYLSEFDKEEWTVIDLGSVESLSTVAQNLYRCLYQLDQYSVDIAYLNLPELNTSSIGKALENRINKLLSVKNDL